MCLCCEGEASQKKIPGFSFYLFGGLGGGKGKCMAATDVLCL